MIPPIVRQMIVCDEVLTDPQNGNRLNTMGLAQVLSPRAGDDYPLKHPRLAILVSLTGGVGNGRICARVRSEETDEVIRETDTHTVTHPVTRNQIAGVTVRIIDCVFEEPGVYWVEFVYEDLVLAQHPIVLRPAR